MPLNWYCEKMPEGAMDAAFVDKAEDGSEKWNANLNACVFGLMAIGMSGITEKNWEKVYERLAMLEELDGAHRHGWDVDEDGKHVSFEVFFTPGEVRSWIGITVNVSVEGDAWFRKCIERGLKREVNYRTRRYAKAVAALGKEWW